jgi:hypothetical protein
VRNFQVINQGKHDGVPDMRIVPRLHLPKIATVCAVGAASLRATLNCDAFATAHSAESHFDRSSFVGLAVNQVPSFFARPFYHCVLKSR